MNREILFRGKRVDNGEWVYGYYLVKAEKHIIWSRGDIQSYQVTPKTIGQFTGLTDKNGNKIFEGDHFGNPKFPVMFVNGCFLAGGLPLIGTIKGNIHDNDQI